MLLTSHMHSILQFSMTLNTSLSPPFPSLIFLFSVDPGAWKPFPSFSLSSSSSLPPSLHVLLSLPALYYHSALILYISTLNLSRSPSNGSGTLYIHSSFLPLFLPHTCTAKPTTATTAHHHELPLNISTPILHNNTR